MIALWIGVFALCLCAVLMVRRDRREHRKFLEQSDAWAEILAARTIPERLKALREGQAVGIPLHKIEEIFDWTQNENTA